MWEESLVSTVRLYRAPDGVTLSADDVGPRNAPTVVLLHGGGQTRHSWSSAMKALVAAGYRVINLDARGHGESDWSDAGLYSLDDHAEDLRLVTADLEQPYALVGASLGGGTAIHAIANGLDPVALVLVDIVPTPEPVGIQRIVGFMQDTSGGFDSMDEVVEAVATYNPHRERPRDFNGLRRNLRRREDGRLYWHWDPKIVAIDSEAHHQTVQCSAAELAQRPDLRVLLVRGLSSDVVSDDSVAAFSSLLPTLEIANVSGAGHMVSGDKNDVFNASVISFLGRTMPPGGGT